MAGALGGGTFFAVAFWPTAFLAGAWVGAAFFARAAPRNGKGVAIYRPSDLPVNQPHRRLKKG